MARTLKPGLMTAPVQPLVAKAMKPVVAKGMAPRMAKPVAAIKPSKPKRPSGQFQGKRESAGQMNGGSFGEVQHPQTHEAFEKL